jgi:hypothetical protein
MQAAAPGSRRCEGKTLVSFAHVLRRSHGGNESHRHPATQLGLPIPSTESKTFVVTGLSLGITRKWRRKACQCGKLRMNIALVLRERGGRPTGYWVLGTGYQDRHALSKMPRRPVSSINVRIIIILTYTLYENACQGSGLVNLEFWPQVIVAHGDRNPLSGGPQRELAPAARTPSALARLLIGQGQPLQDVCALIYASIWQRNGRPAM